MQNFHLTAPGRSSAPNSAFIAGGTDLLQLMKQNVEAPAQLVDLSGQDLRGISTDADGLRLGALATMADVAAHKQVREGWPVIVEALALSESPQIRNMGTMGGNLLQRTRCNYFRDTAFTCNKRAPGSGCPAIAGDSRELGILGVSDSCIATHPSDLPVALMALGAKVAVRGADGKQRDIDLLDFYRFPGDTPNIETVLQPGDLVTAIVVPGSAAARNSSYLKLRDRTSFAFALVSVAVALEVQDGVIRDARIALGGVAPMPWCASKAEASLHGIASGEEAFATAAQLATDGARATDANRYKITLAQNAVRRALQKISNPGSRG